MAGLSHRQTEILNIARAFGRVMVEDLAKRFEVSAQTIRKDLNDLCDQRSLTRIHGGAIIASGVENLAYEARRFVAAEEKRAIGIAAASRIPNGCSLVFSPGWEADRTGGTAGLCQPVERDLFDCHMGCFWPAQVPDQLNHAPDWTAKCAAAQKDWRKIDLIFPDKK